MYRQIECQSLHDFITELKKLSAECEFENLRDSVIKDMIVCGTNDTAFRETLLRESDLTLSRAISAGHTAEETQKHAHEILQSQSALISTKLISSINLVTKVPTKNQNKYLRNVNFTMAPIPEENVQHVESHV